MARDEKSKLLNRLSRIEGQVRGIARMVEEDRTFIDILTQLQAVRAALSSVETEMLKDHLGQCIDGGTIGLDPEDERAKVDELIRLLERGLRNDSHRKMV